MEGGSATIGCEATGICNAFTVLWFKHTTEGNIRVNGTEHGSKYQVLTMYIESQTATDCHCKIGTSLTIHGFNRSDDGCYGCQIVSDNSRPLHSSPCGYVAAGEIMNEHSCTFENLLFTPICAEVDATSQEIRYTSESLNSAINIIPTITKGLHSILIYNTDSTTAVTNMVTLPETSFDRQQNMVWVYGLTTVFLLVIIVLGLSLVLVSIKYRTQQKASKQCMGTMIVPW